MNSKGLPDMAKRWGVAALVGTALLSVLMLSLILFQSHLKSRIANQYAKTAYPKEGVTFTFTRVLPSKSFGLIVYFRMDGDPLGSEAAWRMFTNDVVFRK